MHRKSELASIILVVGAIFGGILLFKESFYIISLTVFSATMITGYLLINSRRRNSLKNSSKKPQKENKPGPDKDIDN
ncbi:MAG: hypothetical protein FGF52_04090 [Candidatus Brockarchaeota archaeon]|nr:hypothetical protein [Candidatus Brockarchaeota archaeon]